MLRIPFALMIVFSLQVTSYAQQNEGEQSSPVPAVNCGSIEAMSSYIRQNFTTDTARIRAIYVWITNHISYDVPRFLTREENPGRPAQTATEVLINRSAVCEGYAELFIALANALGIKAMKIGGYTKQRGKTGSVAHAWVAAELDGVWYLFDPTWGAGQVKNEVFIKRFNDGFYKVPAAKFIADHMPFDPLYQFLSYPLTNREFTDGTAGSSTILFNYNDSIKQHIQLSLASQRAAELRRLEAAGVLNEPLRDRRTFLKNAVQSAASKDAVAEVGKIFKAAVSLYNEYIGHKRKQFSTITDNELRNMIDSLDFYVKQSRALVSESVAKTEAQQEVRSGNMNNIDRFRVQLTKEKEFTEKYLATDKEKRRAMFMKRSEN